MPWCPKCKSEYREGVTICAECGSVLVNDEQFDELVKIEAASALSEDRFQEENRCSKKNRYLEESFQEENRISEADAEDRITDNRESTMHSLYWDSSERASENRSSAWILLVMGGLGLLGAGLGMTGLLPVEFSNPYLIYGVMTAVFLLFIVAGIVSMKNAIIFERKAKSENSLKDILLEWCRESLHREEVDQQIGAEEIASDEILYLKRFECLKIKLNHQFLNLDQGFLDKLIEDCVYDMVFEGEEPAGCAENKEQKT